MQVTDPVCGMTVDTERAAAHGVYDGKAVYFCSGSCQKRFEQKRASSSR